MIQQNNKKLKKSNHLFLLSGDFSSIGAAEIETLAKKKIKFLDSTLIVFDCPEQSLEQPEFLQRLAYTKIVFKTCFYCQASKLNDNIKKFDWFPIYNNDFVARKIVFSSAKSKQAMIPEKELASPIWRCLEAKGIKPKVKLAGSSTEITFIFYKNKVACGIKIWGNREDFQARRPHLRPGFSPISLQPKFARAMVNLTGINPDSGSYETLPLRLPRPPRSFAHFRRRTGIPVGGVPLPVLEVCNDGCSNGGGGEGFIRAPDSEEILYDPFCGTGGILIEAGLMEIKSKGSDLSQAMYWKCLKNIRHFGITEKCSIEKKDARNIDEKMDFIATDLPYGRSSVPRCSKELVEIYKGFAKVLDKQWTGKGRAVICFSDNIDFMKFLNAANKKKDIKKVHEFRIRVHNSLNRRLVVMERKHL